MWLLVFLQAYMHPYGRPYYVPVLPLHAAMGMGMQHPPEGSAMHMRPTDADQSAVPKPMQSKQEPAGPDAEDMHGRMAYAKSDAGSAMQHAVSEQTAVALSLHHLSGGGSVAQHPHVHGQRIVGDAHHLVSSGGSAVPRVTPACQAHGSVEAPAGHASTIPHAMMHAHGGAMMHGSMEGYSHAGMHHGHAAVQAGHITHMQMVHAHPDWLPMHAPGMTVQQRGLRRHPGYEHGITHGDPQGSAAAVGSGGEHDL